MMLSLHTNLQAASAGVAAFSWHDALTHWQMLAVPGLFLVSAGLGVAFSKISLRLLMGVAKRTASAWDDAFFIRLSAPLRLVWSLLFAQLLAPWLRVTQPVQGTLDRLLSAGFLLGLFWALSRAAEVTGQMLVTSAWATTHPASRALIPLGTRIAKVAVLVIACVTVLSGLGYPVASLLAGLGVGGLGIALASQKTVENLFGALSLGADQPFREGDFVRVDDCLGTVEAIGIRSTRIRTLDRTLVSIPNGKLAEMRLESFTARDRIRLACTLGLVYGTRAVQVRVIRARLEDCLRRHPKIWPDSIVVRFKEFGECSLNIEIMAWFVTSDWSEFQSIREEVLLEFMDIVEEAGTSFALPTRTVHLATERTSPASPLNQRSTTPPPPRVRAGTAG